ncbi:hypothetical protein UFOVP965_81 [uncultured Caudovirales phage]|uniref:Uncharacterized protein n=1 Tax=uncultured Caudovirales phage TaxID=2100421 RepID=A0A6J5Q6X2_9CAUD|nr:hypothetical protein UFOVP965_81 [uncultured Caudovirales phage]CAB4179843.1 hypothetical protein UFOVP1035_77 [uncultured Caudovirales phage]CAB4188572.1 hypothetical protein UFOVP1181_36 [uncultured Caudovirales phage]
MPTPPDRSADERRQARIERNEHMQAKFGYELANPKPDTHDAEMEAADKRL